MSGGGAWIAAGLAWGIVVVPAIRRVLPPARTPESDGGARSLAGAGGGLLLFGALSLATRNAEPTPRAAIVLAANAASAAFLALFLTRPAAGFAPRAADRLRRGAASVGRGVVAYVLLLPAVTALNALNLRFLPEAPPTSEVILDLAAGPGSARFWLLLPALLVAVPCFEEIFARGLLQRGVAAELRGPFGARVGTASAVMAASLVFTALHEPASYVVVFTLSLVLGATAARTGSVLAPIGFHGAHNAYAIAYELWLKPWFEARGLV
jgi:membrane protease YdiL (CAAX protease family)